MQLIDSHCHLADERFAADLGDVIDRAVGAGVARVLCIVDPTDEAERRRAARVATLWPGVVFAVGVHPHRAGQIPEPDELAVVLDRALDAVGPVAAVGEIGLDYHYEFAPRSVQQAVFRSQLRVARARHLPVVIHTREADEDTFRILEEEQAGEVGGVFHCFTGDTARARRVLDAGFAVSFSGIVTFPRADHERLAARFTPSDRLLVETDAPFLAPVPHRGQRNEPAYVAAVVEAVARARGEPPARLAEAIRQVFGSLFGRGAATRAGLSR